jgi:plasmid maintenance system antidote protein VapI
MEIKEYLKESNVSRRQFSEKLGIHYMHLNNLIRKERKPSRDLALRIEEATGGAVTRMELLYPAEKGRAQ